MQLVGWAKLVLGRSMRCIRTLANPVDFYGPFLKTRGLQNNGPGHLFSNRGRDVLLWDESVRTPPQPSPLNLQYPVAEQREELNGIGPRACGCAPASERASQQHASAWVARSGPAAL